MITSRMDVSKQIGSDNWAVTMICAAEKNGIKKLNPLGGNHAQLVIEGVNENGYFTKVAHLRGPYSLPSDNSQDDRIDGSCSYFGFGKIGRVAISDLTSKELDCTHTSETWVKTKDLVQKMLAKIQEEVDSPDECLVGFSIFGRKSIFTNKIETFKYRNTSLVGTIFKINPSALMRCFDFYKKWSTEIETELTRPEESKTFWNSGFDPFSPMLSKILSKKTTAIPWLMLFPITGFHTGTEAFIGEANYIKFRVLFSKISSFVEKDTSLSIHTETIDELKTDMKNGKVKSAFNKFCKMTYDELEKVEVMPDSCFTWARKKLEMVDVHLEEKWIESILSPTKLWLKKAEKKEPQK